MPWTVVTTLVMVEVPDPPVFESEPPFCTVMADADEFPQPVMVCPALGLSSLVRSKAPPEATVTEPPEHASRYRYPAFVVAVDSEKVPSTTMGAYRYS